MLIVVFIPVKYAESSSLSSTKYFTEIIYFCENQKWVRSCALPQGPHKTFSFALLSNIQSFAMLLLYVFGLPISKVGQVYFLTLKVLTLLEIHGKKKCQYRCSYIVINDSTQQLYVIPHLYWRTQPIGVVMGNQQDEV